MRSLHVLLAGFGFLMGLIGIAVAFLAESNTPVLAESNTPVRVNFGYVDDYDPLAVGSLPIYLVIALPLLGALLGWLCAVIATRLGWKLSRSK